MFKLSRRIWSLNPTFNKVLNVIPGSDVWLEMLEVIFLSKPREPITHLLCSGIINKVVNALLGAC